MAQQPLSQATLQQTLDAWERCQRSPTIAAHELGLHPDVVRKRVKKARKKGLAPGCQPPPEDSQPDKQARQRLRDELDATRRDLREAHRRLNAHETLREALHGLQERMNIIPPNWEPQLHPGESAPAQPIFWLTDLHCGEVIDPNEVDGLNEYDQATFQRRIRTYIENALHVAFEHEGNPDYHGCILILGGDLITGEIHEELARTNDLADHPALQLVVQELVRAIEVLQERFGCVYVVGVPGNHGRTTRKPPAKQYATLSYDTLAMWMVEQMFAARGFKRVEFWYPRSGDAVFRVAGHTFCLTHGDRIGSSGGQGFVGPEATILRGSQKVRRQYAGWGVLVDYVLIGHFHIHRDMGHTLTAGALIGWNEFARSVVRAEYERPTQPLVMVHPARGVVDHRRIFVEPRREPGNPVLFERA